MTQRKELARAFSKTWDPSSVLRRMEATGDDGWWFLFALSRACKGGCFVCEGGMKREALMHGAARSQLSTPLPFAAFFPFLRALAPTQGSTRPRTAAAAACCFTFPRAGPRYVALCMKESRVAWHAAPCSVGEKKACKLGILQRPGRRENGSNGLIISQL